MCLAAAGVLAMLAASRAHAGWREVTAVTERPNDVLDVWGNGTFSLGYLADSGGGVYLFVDGGVAHNLKGLGANDSVGTSYQPDTGCFVSIDDYGQRVSRGTDGGLCGGVTPGSSIISPDNGFHRVKQVPGGGAAAMTRGNEQHTVLLSGAGIDVPADTFEPVVRLELTSKPDAPFAVTRVGSKIYSFLGSSSVVPNGKWGTLNPKSEPSWFLDNPDGGSVGPLRAVALFPVEGSSVPFAVMGARHAFLQGSTTSLHVAQPLEPGEELVALSMGVEGGGDGGHGFGMALVTRADGSRQVMSPLPMPEEASAGTLWRPRVIPPDVMKNMTAKLTQVACHGASFCVLTAPGETVHNVFTYSNEAGPELSVLDSDGGVVTAMDFEEDENLQLTFLGKDSDGDPVRLTAAYSATGPWEVKSMSAEPGEPVVMDISTRPICQTTDAGHFEVTASDGLAAHEVRRTMPVRVLHTSRPEMPQVVRSDGSVVDPGQLAGELVAGGAPLTLHAVGDRTSANCGWASKRWTRVSTDGPVPTQLEGRATLVPPRFFCEAGGRDYQYQLDVVDEGGLSNFQRYTVHQKPWGAPERVFATDGVVVNVRPGARLELSPEGSHGCVNAPGFPGMVTTWDMRLEDGRVPGPELSIQKQEGGAVTDFPVDATGLVLQTSVCQPPARVRVSATNAVGTERGAPSQRELVIESAWTPLKPDSLQVSLSESAQTLWVDSPLDCEVERELRADLRLEPEDANVPTRTASVAVPGEWSLADLDCGLYHLRATLEDSTGSSMEQQDRQLVLPGRGVSLEPRPQNGMKAVCGQGATMTLSSLVTPTPGFCQTPDYTWTYASALELEQLSEPDGSVRLATKEKELDALLGGVVRVGVTASKGPARTELSFDVPISVDPFVKVGRRSELPVASETGLVSVLVDLTNTTACDVSGARYVEHLEGLAYVEGSATLDGAPVETHWNGSALQVDGLLLAGGATRTLSYVARPLLVGERRMWGEASKGDVRLSASEANEPRPSGCGCASSGSGPMLFVLAALGAALRRRRR
ncbi:MYXO-CTERM sorting domain-containing protein [Cystobacter fuscus]|uniref:MYXO-CTERM sorting domain-containing protein n=1 Tax=Cystobacter fuscus TaxID=43 RepID=UPI000BB39B63|nr:MYXO-CTERM sorting domain-containing protein [Cystobacter fuscus]